MTSVQLAARLSRPPSSCLFWKRAAALLLMRARWRLLKATGGVAASPEPGSCPRPRVASRHRARAGEAPGTIPLPHPTPILTPSTHFREISTMEKGGTALAPRPLAPHPTPPQQERLFFRRNLGRKPDARPSACGDPLWKRPQRETPGEDFTDRGATLGPWRPTPPPASCLRLFLLRLGLGSG